MELSRSSLLIKSPLILLGRRTHFYRASKIYPPLKEFIRPSSNVSSTIAVNLLTSYGLICNSGHGLFSLLPLGYRVVEKLSKIIDYHMKQIDGQKILLPSLTPSSLWEKSGRLDTAMPEIMRVKDRHQQILILGPTHEEAIADVINKTKQLALSRLPLKLYQISSKFRDEPRSKFGLIRLREFLMKDLYTFDATEKDALTTYNEVAVAYENIFHALNLPITRVQSDVGYIGGNQSHEYHLISPLGEDKLHRCKDCGEAFSPMQVDDHLICLTCKGSLEPIQGFELAHTFNLGTKYSAPLSANFLDAKGNESVIYMGCYGIGVSRLIGASLEVLSSADKLVWPRGIEPFKICVVPPKIGSNEYVSMPMCDHLVNSISEMDNYKDDVMFDDRTKLTIGRRFRYANKIGCPIIIVGGHASVRSIPLFELHDNINDVTLELTQLEILNYLGSLKSN